jgi:hypothetical protein
VGDGGPDSIEGMSDARRIGIERVVNRQSIKWHDGKFDICRNRANPVKWGRGRLPNWPMA